MPFLIIRERHIFSATSFMRQAQIIIFILVSLYLETNFVLAQDTNDSLKADALYTKGREFILSNPDSSLFFLEEARKLYKIQKRNKKVVTCLLVSATTCMRHDFLEKAHNYSTSATKVAKELLGESDTYYFYALLNQATLYYFQGNFGKAIEGLNSLLELTNSVPESRHEERFFQRLLIQSYNNLASSYAYQGDLEEAVRYDDHTLQLRQKWLSPFDREMAIAYTTKASTYIDLGKPILALENLRKCIDVLNQNDFKRVYPDYVDAYYKMARCHLMLNQLDSAYFFLEKAKDSQNPDAPRRPQIIATIEGEILALKGDHSTALEAFRRALEMRQEVYGKITKHRDLATSLTQLADAHLHLQDHPAALQHYQLALAASHPTMTGDEAVDFFPSIEALQYPILCIPVLDKKAQALLQRNGATLPDRKLAQECYKRVDSLLSRTLRELRSAESRAFFSEEFRPIYERAIGNCYELYQETGDDTYLAQAFAYSERSKAILLSLALRDSKAKIEGGLPAEILEKEHQLRTDVATYRKRIFEAKATTDSLLLEGWRAKLFELEEDFRKLVAQMEQEYPNYYQVKYGLVTVTPEQVQANLRGKDHQLIAYFLGDSVLYQFVFSKEQVQLHKQPFGEEVHAHLSNLLPLLHTPDANGLSAFKTHASALYPTLLPQAYSDNPPETLTIIPDGKLGFLPFGVLLTKQTAPDADYRYLPYLLKDTQISYGYSATLIHTSFRQQPTFTQNLSAFAPAYEGALRLSTNQPQATAVASQLDGEAYLAGAASETTFRQMAPASRILHLAMHGMPDEKQALYAHLLFGPSTDSAEDGKLHAYELYNLSLNTQLVTLSACESGYGKLALGEGILSLARAFRYAGCQSILFSHWKVDGRAANDLLTGFYEQIDQGKRPSQAIWQAQNEFLATAPPDQVHPYYWANFVLTGEDEPLSKPFYKWWIGGGLILLLVVFFIFFRRK